MENETQAVHITDWRILSFHIFDVDHLRCHIARSTTPHKQIRLNIRELSKAKISDNTIPLSFFSEQQVFRFEIPVHDPLGMHLPKPTENAMNNNSGMLDFESMFSLCYNNILL